MGTLRLLVLGLLVLSTSAGCRSDGRAAEVLETAQPAVDRGVVLWMKGDRAGAFAAVEAAGAWSGPPRGEDRYLAMSQAELDARDPNERGLDKIAQVVYRFRAIRELNEAISEEVGRRSARGDRKSAKRLRDGWAAFAGWISEPNRVEVFESWGSLITNVSIPGMDKEIGAGAAALAEPAAVASEAAQPAVDRGVALWMQGDYAGAIAAVEAAGAWSGPPRGEDRYLAMSEAEAVAMEINALEAMKASQLMPRVGAIRALDREIMEEIGRRCNRGERESAKRLRDGWAALAEWLSEPNRTLLFGMLGKSLKEKRIPAMDRKISG